MPEYFTGLLVGFAIGAVILFFAPEWVDRWIFPVFEKTFGRLLNWLDRYR